MIQEDQQLAILSSDKESSNEQGQIQIIENKQKKIHKSKHKRRQRLIWVPLIMKNILQEDTEPVFVYNLFRMMKRYDDVQMEKYSNYGIQDAGIGYIDSIQLDKEYQSVDFSLNTLSIGQTNMNYLIQLYKSYQNQQYYDLAIALQEYQDFAIQHQKFFEENFSLIPYSQIQIDQEYFNFEKAVKEWLNANYENDMNEVVLGQIDIEKKTPVLKKLIYSKNLLLFIGEELSQTYNLLSYQRNFDFLTNFLRQKKPDGKTEIDYNIRLLKQATKYNINLLKEEVQEIFEFEMDDEIQTLDGYTIPTKKTIKSLFYDLEKGEITKDINTHFIILTQYSFEPSSIKFLIDQRLNNNKSNQQVNINKSNIFQQNTDENFEYMCLKEYFLEKFNYQSQKPNSQR